MTNCVLTALCLFIQVPGFSKTNCRSARRSEDCKLKKYQSPFSCDDHGYRHLSNYGAGGVPSSPEGSFLPQSVPLLASNDKLQGKLQGKCV